MDIEIVERESERYVVMGHKGAYPMIGSVFGKLIPLAGELGVPVRGTAAFFYDDPREVAEVDLRSDAGVMVPGDFALDHPELRVLDVPAGTYAKCVHVGSYAGLAETWERFMERLAGIGRVADGVWDFEVYVSDCSVVAEDELVTELYCSVR